MFLATTSPPMPPGPPACQVWVAGNVADPHSQVITAAAAGLKAGAAINADLITEETARAVTAFRAQNVAMCEPLTE